MTDPPPSGSPVAGATPADRLDSWKEIAAYLRRDVTTAQRWERREGMPVHRHQHDKMGSVYAFRSELEAWARSRSPDAGAGEGAQVAGQPGAEDRAADAHGIHDDPDRELRIAPTPMPATPPRLRRRLAIGAAGATAVVLAAALLVSQLLRREPGSENPLVGARFHQLTDFDGVEQAAALSRDGRFVAFQSDRDGRMDVWVTQIGTGQFSNLTRGAGIENVNPSLRALGFSPDGTLVTFWRRRGGSEKADIGVWAAPLLGGAVRPYLDGVAEYDWAADGARLVYHTPGPGDPMFVRDPGPQSEARNIFSAPPGLHSHFLVWSPDQAFIYFVQGALPDRLDIWRIRPFGGTPERITRHDSLVSHPVFIDERTLLYLATDPDGTGPRIHSIDVERRIPRRLSFGIDSYTSLSASADGRRIVATRASRKGTLWRLPMSGTRAEMSAARRIPLITGNGSFPRLGAGYLLYVSSKGGSDSLWKLQDDGTATELWSAPEVRVIGAPAIRRDGHRVALSVRQSGGTPLYVVNADGTGAAVVTRALELEGTPAWMSDGQSMLVAAVVEGIPRLFKVPLDGGSPVPFVTEHSVDPVWSPAGDIVAFSGADVGTTFPIKAVKADASAYPLPALRLTRGARHLFFMPQGRSLVVLRGEIGHKNLWMIDLETGAEHQITDLAPDFNVRDFDLSPDGREIVLEQVKERSNAVLIELPR